MQIVLPDGKFREEANALPVDNLQSQTVQYLSFSKNLSVVRPLWRPMMGRLDNAENAAAMARGIIHVSTWKESGNPRETGSGRMVPAEIRTGLHQDIGVIACADLRCTS